MAVPLRHFSWKLAVAIALSALCLAAALNRRGLLRLGWSGGRLGAIIPESGHAYTARTGHAELSSDEGPSDARVLEDGRPLSGPANALHADIRRIGGGRYSFWHAYVYFSASDNSDPAHNGREYSFAYPRRVNWAAAAVLYLAAALAWAAWPGTAGVLSWTRDHPLPVGISMMTGAYLSTRLPFFLHHPVAGFTSDSYVYVRIARAIGPGTGWPRFFLRTPGYPLFLRLLHCVSGDWLAVVAVQGVCFLAALILLLVAVRSCARSLVLPAALVLCGYLASSDVVIYETSVLAESLYATMVIASTAWIMLSLADPSRTWRFFAASAAMAGAILVRPSGLYLVVVALLVAAFALWNDFPKKAVAAVLAPLTGALLGFCLYNYATLGSFTVSPIGRMALAAATALYIEPDPGLNPEINRVLARVPEANRNSGVTEGDLAVVRESWNPKLLYPVFMKPFFFVLDPNRYGRLFEEIVSGDRVANLRGLGDAETLAIRRHPVFYAKFVLTNLCYFYGSIAGKGDISEELDRRRSGAPPPSWEEVRTAAVISAPPQVGLPPRVAREFLAVRIQQEAQAIQSFWFGGAWWRFAYFLAAMLAAVRAVRSRGRHHGACVVALVAVVPLGAALVTCLCNVAIARYVFPTEFAVYLTVALAPLAWMANDALLQRERLPGKRRNDEDR